MTKKLNVAIIGSNFGLKGYLPVIKKINKFNLKIICSRNISKIKDEIKIDKNLEYINNWKLIFKKKIDLIICAVPPKIQEKILIHNFKFKKKIIFEKPISSNLKKSKKIAQTIVKKKIKCDVNLTYLFHPLFRRVKDMIDKKILGKVKSFKIKWSFFSYDFDKKIKSWKTIENQGGGIKNIFLTHIFSYCEYFFGKMRLDKFKCDKEIFKKIIYKKKIFCELSNYEDIKGKISVFTKKKGYQNHIVKIFFEKGHITLSTNSSDWTKNFKLTISNYKNVKVKYLKYTPPKKFKDGRSDQINFLITKFLKKSNYNNLFYCLNAEKINYKIT